MALLGISLYKGPSLGAGGKSKMALKSRQWNNLLEALENGSCIVLLGPMVSTASDGGVPLANQFAMELSKTLEEEETCTTSRLRPTPV